MCIRDRYIGDTSEGRHFYTMDHRYHAFGTELTCMMQLRIVYENDTEELVATDESWGTWESPVTLANAYGAEDYDGEKACTWEELFELFKKNKVKVLSEQELSLIHILRPVLDFCVPVFWRLPEQIPMEKRKGLEESDIWKRR